MTQMKTVDRLESMFGNTEKRGPRRWPTALARAGSQVAVADVRHVRPSDLAGCDLLVLGAPTHTFCLSRPSPRARCGPPGCGRGPRGRRPPRVAGLAGRARSLPAWTVRRRGLRHPGREGAAPPGLGGQTGGTVAAVHGFEVIDHPTSFYVEDLKGPPTDGELDRAGTWATRLADGLRSRTRRDVS